MADEILDDSPKEMSLNSEKVNPYLAYVIKPDQVMEVWEAADPNAAMITLLQEHLEYVEESEGNRVNDYSANEKRYEPESELKWLSDYLIQAFIFFKGDLMIEDNELNAELLQMMWGTLDFTSF